LADPRNSRRRPRRNTRGSLDAWFGTAARYAGLGLLVYSVAVDRLKNPALLPAATGLMFLKNVTGR
jgi:hypothetical protein